MNSSGLLIGGLVFKGLFKPKYRATIFLKYISVILAFVVYSIKLVTSAVGISLPSVFCNMKGVC